MLTRRRFIHQSTAAAGATAFLPFAARAQEKAGDRFETSAGDVEIFPIAHASFVMTTPAGVIYNDPVGDAAQYAGLPAPDLILVTHEHGDHYNAETLAALVGENTQILTNPAVFAMLPEALRGRAASIPNGETAELLGIPILAVPAYNLSPDRMKYHPEGRDNGYLLALEGLSVYIAGDTEDTPEMRALKNIDIAFLPMNLPFTMDEAQAADAVAAFGPKYVYPYHYKGSDPEKFAGLVASGGAQTKVVQGPWYS